RSTTEQRDQLAPFHRDDPKPRTMRSIAGQGRASQQKRPLIVRFGSFTSHPPAANLSACPLCPRKRTNSGHLGMSALCQKRTHALQQIPSYSGPTKSPATSIIPRLLTIATYIGRAPMPIGRLRAIEENPMTLF